MEYALNDMNQSSETHLVGAPLAAPKNASAVPAANNGGETCLVGAGPVGHPRPIAVPAANNSGETCLVGAEPVGHPRPIAVPAANNSGETCLVGAEPVGHPRPIAVPAANNGGETCLVGAEPVGHPRPIAVPAANNGVETCLVGAEPVGHPRPIAVPAANNGGETCLVGAEPVGHPRPIAVPAANNGVETCLVGGTSEPQASTVSAIAVPPTVISPAAVPAMGHRIPQPQIRPPAAAPSATEVSLSDAPLPVGTQLDQERYEILETIHAGGFGKTYKAREVETDLICAIKESFPRDYVGRAPDGLHVIAKSEEVTSLVDEINRSFHTEARTIATLTNKNTGSKQNIINVMTAFKDFGTVYYVMDFIEGQSLTKAISAEHLNDDYLISLLIKILNGLEFVHQNNTYHLDIKPDNILLKSDGTPVLIDFGASFNTEKAEGHGLLSATFGYAPPEQRDTSRTTEIGVRSDIYALGATFYHLLTGKCPEAKSVPQPLQQMDAAQVHGVSRAFRAAIDRAMQQAPGSRWESATEWKELLLAMQKAKEDAIKLHEGR